MAKKKIKWTKQQRRAITRHDSDVFVTASAGTGKTAVLSGRCVDIVSDKTKCPDVFNVLVLTFTDAAAEQMRLQISEQLEAVFLESGSGHLRRQLILLQGAEISTIHSFCKRLITQYFYKLGLDPTFRVIDSDEAKLLKAEVLEETINWAWGQSNLVQGLELLLRRRDLRATDGFVSKIIELSDFLDSVVSRSNWYERASVLAEAVNPFKSELGEEQKKIVEEELQNIFTQIQYAQKLYENERTNGDWAEKLEESHIKSVVQCIEFLKAGDWDKCAEGIRNFAKPVTRKPKELTGPIAGLIYRTVKNAVDDFLSLSDFVILNPDYLDMVGGTVSLQTKILIELVKKFDGLYSRAKLALNCLDFADLEHYALKLLAEEEGLGDELLPSETALSLREKYRYIFVDEYQDINPVQQAILDMLSREDNVFGVGDVKQSIYGFRGTEPRIFIRELKTASVEPKQAKGGLRVDLSYNFRSRKGILDFVNKMFSRIMTARLADIDYDESAELRPMDNAVSESNGGPVVELHILEEQSRKDTTENQYTTRQFQAAMVAQRIKEMVGAEAGKAEFQIYDKRAGQMRDVEYRDIVILMRSPAKRVNDYLEVLRLAGVPVSCETSSGYFETTEISDCLCLLKVLDNPRRDIELAAILRSPFFNISDAELAEIKVHSRTDERYRSFYECVLGYSVNGRDSKLSDELKKILEKIGQWRTVGRRGNLADLIWQIYRQTGYLSFVSALPNGRTRRANLLKLHDRAIQFEDFASSGGNISLRRFVEFIEGLQEASADWALASPEAEVENAVRIMSVHKSKGLEFPVVFLAELNSEFSSKDFRSDCLADAGYTLGLRIIDSKSNTKLDSLAYQLIERQKRGKFLAEEMRILYVATTRARERLILSASERKKSCNDIICDGFYFGDGPIADRQLRRCWSHLEWILYGLSDQRSLHDVFGTDLGWKCGKDDLFSVKLYAQAEVERLSGYINKLKQEKSRGFELSARSSRPERAKGKILTAIKASLGWRYTFADAALLPAKQSVTQLTHRSDEYFLFDYSRALERKPKAVLSVEPDSKVPVEGRLIGTAT
ncbi:MAG: helicase-exonuclease AddAB subunit AddA, partial [Planctomycetota bacterium]